MCLKAALLVTFLCGTIKPPVVEGKGKILGRVYGGTYAIGIDFPWLVALSRNGIHWCGGSILNTRSILTAAHCIYGADTTELTVRVGSKFKSSGGQLISVNDAVYHVNYDQISFDYDIGVLRLSWDIIFSKDVHPIALPGQEEDLHEGTEAILSGWGLTEQGDPEYLRYVVVNILGEDTCRVLYTGYYYTERMLCAGHLNAAIDHCHGDSGGPLVVDGTVVGIVSYTAGHGCGLPHEAGVYTKVSAIVTWIRDYVGEFGEILQ